MKKPLRSKGKPEYCVWAYNKLTKKWDCWGEVHSAKDYPNMLELINNNSFFHSIYEGNNNYEKVVYLPNDGNHNPNRQGVL